MREILDVAVAAARAGGAVLEAKRDDMGAVRTKSTSIDFVTEADVASGVAAVRSILGHFPDARFVIEEEEVYDLAEAEQGTLADECVWVIDPLDGTTSFVHGYPMYSVSVAYMERGVPVAGAVYNAAAAEMNSAAAGLGAWRDGARLQVGDAASVREALLITGFPYDRTRPLDVQLAILGAFLRAPVHGIRRDGSAALDCCHVAGGRADGFWEFGLKPWDMAAGVVVLREAGAEVTDTDGSPWTPASTGICCANPGLHAEMLRVIAEAGSGV